MNKLKRIMFVFILLMIIPFVKYNADDCVATTEDDVVSKIENSSICPTVILGDDITLTLDSIDIGGGMTKTIDLNGHTITNSQSYSAIYVDGNSNLTITDSSNGEEGKIIFEGQGKAKAVVQCYGGATVNLEKGTLIRIHDARTVVAVMVGLDDETCNFYMSGGKIQTNGFGLTLTGNASFNMTDGEIESSNNCAIGTNGTAGKTTALTTFNISGGTLTSDSISDDNASCGIISAGLGTVNFGGTAIINSNKGPGIVARGGIVNVTGGTINTDAESVDFTGKVGDANVLVPVSGIVVDSESNYPGYQSGGITVSVSGDVEIDGKYTPIAFVGENSDENVSITLSAGKYNKNPLYEYDGETLIPHVALAAGKGVTEVNNDYYVKNVYDVTLSITNGSVTTSAFTIGEGEGASTAYAANEGYTKEEASVSCDDGITGEITNGNVVLSNVTASGACTVTLKQVHTVTTPVSIGGNITTPESNQTVIHGHSTTATSTANTNYVYDRYECNEGIAEVSVENGVVTYTNVQSDIQCTVYYVRQYNVTLEVTNGTATTASDAVKEGSNATLAATPNTHYEYDSVTCTGTHGDVSYDNGTITVANVQSDSVCTLNYRKITYDVTLGVVGGSATKSIFTIGESEGDTTTFAANEGYTTTEASIVCPSGITGSIDGTTVTLSNVTASGACTITLKGLYQVLTGVNVAGNMGEGGLQYIVQGHGTTVVTFPSNLPEGAINVYNDYSCEGTADVSVDWNDQTKQAIVTYTNVQSDVVCNINYIRQYTATLEVVNGTATKASDTVNAGSNATLTATPTDEYYVYDNLTCNGEVGTNYDAATYTNGTVTLTNVDGNITNLTCTLAYKLIDYTVTFNKNGASSADIPNQSVARGSLATKPADPHKPDERFFGWYNADTNEPYDFTTPVYSNTDLVAKFGLVVPAISDGDNTSASEESTSTATAETISALLDGNSSVTGNGENPEVTDEVVDKITAAFVAIVDGVEGATVKVKVVTEDFDSTDENQAAAKDSIVAIGGDLQAVVNVEVILEYNDGTQEGSGEVNLTKLSSPVTIKLVASENSFETIPSGYNRVYKIYTYHNGTAKLVKTLKESEVTHDGEGNIIFELQSSEFSIYGITYTDTKKAAEEADYDDDEDITLTNAYGYIKLTWDEADTGKGYLVYRKVSGGKYKLVKTITKLETTKFVDRNVKKGVTYYYKVRNYKIKKGKTVKLDAYTVVSGSLKKMPSTNAEIYKEYKNKIKMTWDRVKGSGYVIYRTTEEDGKYTLIATITDNTTTSYVDRKLESGKTYYYKIRAFKTISGTRRNYGSFTKLEATTIAAEEE